MREEETQKKFQQLFENYYNEKNKKTQLFGMREIIVMLIFFGTVMAILINVSNREFNILKTIVGIIFICIISLILYLVTNKKQKIQKQKNIYLKEIVEPLLRELDPVTDVMINQNINTNLYKRAKFGDSPYNSIYGNNYIICDIDSGQLHMSNLGLYYEETWHEDGKTYTNVKKIFTGFLIVACLNKKITDGYIHIFTDMDDKAIIKRKDRNDKIHMDSIQFEKNFDVYSTDPIKALMILTPDEMQKLLDERIFLNSNYEISISENIVAIKIHNREIFELTNVEYVYEPLKNITLGNLKFVEHIIEFSSNFSNYIDTKI